MKRPALHRRLVQPACVVAALVLSHLAWRRAAGHAGEIAVDTLLLSGWIAWHVRQATKPRMRVATWHRPRGIDAIRRPD